MTTLLRANDRRLLALCAVLVVAALGAASASATTATVPPLGGNAKAGKTVFVANCGLCHALKAAATTGAIGPNLDKVILTQPLLVKAITLGGKAVMTKAAAAKYSVPMSAYKGTLSAKQILNASAFIFTATHK
ncbi:MAG: cytochrome c [Actinomycetes bacterium]